MQKNPSSNNWDIVFCFLVVISIIGAITLRQCGQPPPDGIRQQKEKKMENDQDSKETMEPTNEILAEAGTPAPEDTDVDTVTDVACKAPQEPSAEALSEAPVEEPQDAPAQTTAVPKDNTDIIRNLMAVQAQVFFNALARLPNSREKSLAVTNFQTTMFWVNEHFAEAADRAAAQTQAMAMKVAPT